MESNQVNRSQQIIELVRRKMEQNSQMQREKEPFKTRLDIYRNLIVELPDKLNDNHGQMESGTTALNNIFCLHSSKESSDGTKRLSLNGNDLFLRLGRRLRDSDVPTLLNFLRENPEVADLNLAYNEIHCPGFVNIINYIIIDNRIVNLNLQNNEIGSLGIAYLCEVGEKLQLKILRLSGNKFGVESSKQIALLLLKNRYLQRLDIAEVDQTASSLIYFTTVLRSDQNRYNDTLKILDISRPNPGCMYYFDTAHFASLIGSMLKNNNCLEELYLRKFGFSCHDIELLLIEGRYNKTLLILNLSCNNVGDFGIELLAKWLAERPVLSGLLLAHNIMTSTGATSLSYGIPYSKLTYLDVSYNRISDFGVTEILNSIKKSPRMRHLRIYGNALGRDTAKIVNRMLLSGVLIQENLDVKPYVIGHEWFCACYPASPCKLDPRK